MRRLGLLVLGVLACVGVALAQQQEVEEKTAAHAPVELGPTPAVMAPKASTNRLIDIALAGSRLVAVGQQGVILASDDAKAWKQSVSPVSTMLTRVVFTGAQTGWALGYDAVILQSTDGGATWTLRHHDPKGRALYDLLFLDAQHALAVGAYGTMLETGDGGATWTARDDALTGLGMHLNSLQKLGDGSLFVAGERGLMARSTDSGATWAVLDSPYAGSLFGALPHGEKGALVYGMRGNVYTADDLGTCPVVDVATWDPYSRQTSTDPAQLATLGWRKIESPIRESLFGAVVLAQDNVLLVGVNGTTLKFDSAAGSIAAVKTPAVETLAKAVRFGDHVIAVGRRGVEDLGAAP